MGKSSESVQCAVLKACDACADISINIIIFYKTWPILIKFGT